MRRKDFRSSGATGRGNVQHMAMELKQIRMHPTFVGLLPIDEKLLAYITQDMREHGYYESKPITLGIWPGLQESVLIDGHARVRAAGDACISHVPAVVMEFEDEAAALQHAMSLQTKRRTTTDGALYRLCERYDRLMERGGDRRSEEAKSKGTRVPFDTEQSRSSQSTASLLGCNYKKVEKIRKIRKDGTPEIQRAVRNDKIRINRAYKLIRDMEQGKDAGREDSSVARMKVGKMLLSEDNLAVLKDLGGDLSTHVNVAIEMYIRWLQDQKSALPPEQEPGIRQLSKLEVVSEGS